MIDGSSHGFYIFITKSGRRANKTRITLNKIPDCWQNQESALVGSGKYCRAVVPCLDRRCCSRAKPSPFSFARWKLESDADARRLLGSHQLLDGFDQVLDHGIVRVQTILQLVDLSGETPVRRQHFAQTHECAHHKNAHLNGPRRIEYRRRHDSSVLSEGMRRISAATAAFL